jgi:hypothetical protein
MVHPPSPTAKTQFKMEFFRRYFVDRGLLVACPYIIKAAPEEAKTDILNVKERLEGFQTKAPEACHLGILLHKQPC